MQKIIITNMPLRGAGAGGRGWGKNWKEIWCPFPELKKHKAFSVVQKCNFFSIHL